MTYTSAPVAGVGGAAGTFASVNGESSTSWGSMKSISPTAVIGDTGGHVVFGGSVAMV